MATIKSYTDISQSKTLSKILSLESADMYYDIAASDIDGEKAVAEVLHRKLTKNDCEVVDPCWSLASLLDVLPNNENISTELSKGGYRISTLEYTNSWFVDYEDETDGLNNCVTSADNPVDACVAMIEKLNELNLL